MASQKNKCNTKINLRYKIVYKKKDGMKRIFIAFLLIVIFSKTGFCQQRKSTEQSASGKIGFASGAFTTAFGYSYLWNFGKKKQWQMGAGARLTNSFGSKNYFITAPAKLTSGKSGPGVFFAEQLVQNIDSVYILKPQINAVNITVNFGYKINDKFSVGFDIDAIGFSFGSKQKAVYSANNGSISNTNTTPTSFNLLLVSDNDLGTLNSEFFAKYSITKKWAATLGFQFLFTEVTTDTKIQTTPTGDKNDRFRYKAGGLSLGATYNF
jgi:hypothetical protein